MNLNDIEEVLGTLALDIESNYKPKPHFLWEPLP